jgi:Inhibitor of Apoptosis domain
MQPHLPAYEDMDMRETSFHLCTQLGKSEIRDLVSSGFVFIRSSDICVCFSCCLQLNIRNNSHSFEHYHIQKFHAANNPFCAFLHRTQGRVFIFDAVKETQLFSLLEVDWYNPNMLLDNDPLADASNRQATLRQICRDCTFLSPDEIAANGFYFNNEKDAYVCYYCIATFKDLRQFDMVTDFQAAHAKQGMYCRMCIFYMGRKTIDRLAF